MAKANFTLKQQIACLGREVALRERLYPRWVENGKMKPEAAEFELNCMKSIFDWLKAHKSMVDEALKYMEEQESHIAPTLFNETDA